MRVKNKKWAHIWFETITQGGCNALPSPRTLCTFQLVTSPEKAPTHTQPASLWGSAFVLMQLIHNIFLSLKWLSGWRKHKCKLLANRALPAVSRAATYIFAHRAVSSPTHSLTTEFYWLCSGLLAGWRVFECTTVQTRLGLKCTQKLRAYTPVCVYVCRYAWNRLCMCMSFTCICTCWACSPAASSCPSPSTAAATKRCLTLKWLCSSLLAWK